jgi:hypothetical protein
MNTLDRRGVVAGTATLAAIGAPVIVRAFGTLAPHGCADGG